MDLIKLTILLSTVILTSGCTEYLEELELENSFVDETVYDCVNEPCSEEEIRQAHLNCDNAKILVERSDSFSSVTLRNNDPICNYSFKIDKSTRSFREGLYMNCQIPIERMDLILKINESQVDSKEVLKFCTGSFKDFLNDPSQWFR